MLIQQTRMAVRPESLDKSEAYGKSFQADKSICRGNVEWAI
ncbi:hypothetical protein OHAE_4782 [Ochrobactrum soli]|uniref:Uncharacterized protein n=1 Tax=Ochrobactrum soli TaxID=2448455 RepID=A0A2P9HDT4_9HYPH|nr:hypothetical protein OHAE_4782 [[Ochrobactrum] soli]